MKSGQSFLGLELKGWLYFGAIVPGILLLGWLSYQVMMNGILSFSIVGLISGLFYYLFMVDERTGVMNGQFLKELVDWFYAEKVQIFFWEDQFYDKIHTLRIRVNLKKKKEE